jgi:hypothetical protein
MFVSRLVLATYAGYVIEERRKDEGRRQNKAGNPAFSVVFWLASRFFGKNSVFPTHPQPDSMEVAIPS